MTGYQSDANIYKQISVEIKYKLLERRVTILVPLRLPHPNDARNHRNLLRRSSSHFPASFAAQSPWSQGLGGLKGEQIGRHISVPWQYQKDYHEQCPLSSRKPVTVLCCSVLFKLVPGTESCLWAQPAVGSTSQPLGL